MMMMEAGNLAVNISLIKPRLVLEAQDGAGPGSLKSKLQKARVKLS